MATHLLARPLGLLGWDHLEAVLLAALATQEPLLLIGKHGTAKSFLLERLAQALRLDYRFYNASLVNYDDLVGIPVPNADQTALRYISTPTAIWDAQVVFIDELNRTRPDLQNKLFSIIHERRVQGVPLQRLRYRWAAMNPPPSASGEDDEVYLGAEPLDPALADRFAFLIEVPDWCDLSDSDKNTILLDQFRGRHEFPLEITDLVARASAVYETFCANPPDLCGYFNALETQLRKAGTRLSSRRVPMLLRNALGIHAARLTLASLGGTPAEASDWEPSLFLAINHGHPAQAAGPLDRGALLGLHRLAWNITGLKDNDPWRQLLNIADPVDRVLAASRVDFLLSETDFSSLVIEAVAAQTTPELRTALALVLYLKLRSGKSIAATAAETLASQLERVLAPANATHQVYGTQLTKCREVSNICSGLGHSPRDQHSRNLLQSFLPSGFTAIEPTAVLNRFRALWHSFGIEELHPAPPIAP